MSPTEARDTAIRVLFTDLDAALHLAHTIDDPWYACQALSWIARYAPENRFEGLVDEAFEATWRAGSAFQIVAGSAWPLRACVERGWTDRIEGRLPDLYRIALNIEVPASRSESLFLGLQAVFPAGRTSWQPALGELARASFPVIHWRQRRNLRDAVLMIAREDYPFAREYGQTVRDDRLRSQIEKGLARAEFLQPRPFFWQNSS